MNAPSTLPFTGEVHMSDIDAIMPSHGVWIRRRKNDGALNRVPKKFYPKVWKVLSKTTGLRIGAQEMNSEPIISESTPGEFNFGIIYYN